MSLNPAEIALRWMGGIMTYSILAVILYGVWRGTRRPAGRITGTNETWLRSPWFYLVTTALFIWAGYLLWRSLSLTISPTAHIWMQATGSLLYFPGILLVLWGRLALGKNYFVSSGFGAQLFAEHQLVTSGPFSFVRHPMYAGLILAAFGSLLVYTTWTTLLFACFAPLTTVRIRHEEDALASEFGGEWHAYCRWIPALIPRFSKSSSSDKGTPDD
jgi:protein-S-isoprenylcysteine O-methyltransferase Ste14